MGVYGLTSGLGGIMADNYHLVFLKDGTNYVCQCKTRTKDHEWREKVDMEESKIVTIIAAELDWSSRHGKTFRFHAVEAAINKVLESELQDLSKSFIEDKGYTGYMVKQVINARLNKPKSGRV